MNANCRWWWRQRSANDTILYIQLLVSVKRQVVMSQLVRWHLSAKCVDTRPARDTQHQRQCWADTSHRSESTFFVGKIAKSEIFLACEKRSNEFCWRLQLQRQTQQVEKEEKQQVVSQTKRELNCIYVSSFAIDNVFYRLDRQQNRRLSNFWLHVCSLSRLPAHQWM